MQIDSKGFLADLRSLVADVEKAASDSIGKAVSEALRHAQTTPLFKDRTHTLRTEIFPEHTGNEGSITAKAPYALYVNAGTRPHPIPASGNRGGDGMWLNFLWVEQGRQMRLRKVNQHPGTTARPFMDEAEKWGEIALQQSSDELVQNAISKFNAK